jgi:hypothetical protein
MFFARGDAQRRQRSARSDGATLIFFSPLDIFFRFTPLRFRRFLSFFIIFATLLHFKILLVGFRHFHCFRFAFDGFSRYADYAFFHIIFIDFHATYFSFHFAIFHIFSFLLLSIFSLLLPLLMLTLSITPFH